MAIEAVVYDIGNVLIEWVPERFYEAELGPARTKAFFDEVPILKRHFLTDEGADFRKTIYQAADDFPKWRVEIEQWYTRWNELAGNVIEGSVKAMHALQAQGIPVFALSNFGVENFAMSQKQHSFLNEFDRFYISGALKVAKPNPDIYAALEEDSGVAPDRLLFVDDRQDNIDAAAARGWQNHLFSDTKSWQERLVSEKLLPKNWE